VRDLGVSVSRRRLRLVATSLVWGPSGSCHFIILSPDDPRFLAPRHVMAWQINDRHRRIYLPRLVVLAWSWGLYKCDAAPSNPTYVSLSSDVIQYLHVRFQPDNSLNCVCKRSSVPPEQRPYVPVTGINSHRRVCTGSVCCGDYECTAHVRAQAERGVGDGGSGRDTRMDVIRCARPPLKR